jgi:hypothetical protein
VPWFCATCRDCWPCQPAYDIVTTQLAVAWQSLTYIAGHETVLDQAKTLHYAMHNSAKQALQAMAALAAPRQPGPAGAGRG